MEDQQGIIQTSSISLYANPLGDVNTRWILPIQYISGKEVLSFPLINYKYVLSEILKVPVPLSYKAVEIQTEIIRCQRINEKRETIQDIPYEISSDFEMNKTLQINISWGHETSDIHFLLLEYTSKGLVSSDGIFFKIVYPIVNTFNDPITLNIDAVSHFSFGIRKHKFYTMSFDSFSSKPLKRKFDFRVEESQDKTFIKAQKILLQNGEEVDLHLQASRLPFIIKKDYFWIVIFILVICLALLPILNFIKSL